MTEEQKLAISKGMKKRWRKIMWQRKAGRRVKPILIQGPMPFDMNPSIGELLEAIERHVAKVREMLR